MLATGGAAALWERTTNPRGAIGAGMSLAHHAGATLADLELIQFHPTALVADDEHDGFLITEAVRGEGALLVDAAGERFVEELAPRDVVALAVKHKLEESGAASVGLDLRASTRPVPEHLVGPAAGRPRPCRRPVPVAPAAHYMMGGIETDLDGRSSIPGLYAVGECACTGLHGANRIASNSLAECFVFAHRVVLAAAAEPRPATDPGSAPDAAPSPVPPASSRSALWRLAGLERTPEGLAELAEDPFPLARLIARCALARTESRGAHQRTDFPAEDPAFDGMHTVVARDAPPRLEPWI